MTTALTVGFRATCAAGHEHYARPTRSEVLPATCRYPKCDESLEWKRDKR